MILFKCPHCGHTLRIPDEYVGTAGICKKCRQQIVAPTGDSLQDSPPLAGEDIPSVCTSAQSTTDELARMNEKTSEILNDLFEYDAGSAFRAAPVISGADTAEDSGFLARLLKTNLFDENNTWHLIAIFAVATVVFFPLFLAFRGNSPPQEKKEAPGEFWNSFEDGFRKGFEHETGRTPDDKLVQQVVAETKDTTGFVVKLCIGLFLALLGIVGIAWLLGEISGAVRNRGQASRFARGRKQ